MSQLEPTPPVVTPPNKRVGLKLFLKEIRKLDILLERGKISTHDYEQRMIDATALLYHDDEFPIMEDDNDS